MAWVRLLRQNNRAAAGGRPQRIYPNAPNLRGAMKYPKLKFIRLILASGRSRPGNANPPIGVLRDAIQENRVPWIIRPKFLRSTRSDDPTATASCTFAQSPSWSLVRNGG